MSTAEFSRSPLRPTAAARSASVASLRALAVPLLLFGSGCASLVYEVVWFQVLSLVVGSSAVSLAVILGTYMGGMSLGSLAFARAVPRSAHPLRVYALIELGIAAFALLLLVLLPYAGGLYVAVGGAGARGLAARALVSALCLLGPTALMGATLPALGRWVEPSPRGAVAVGWLYAANTAGGVAGCLLAGYWLLRVHDAPYATWCAAALNAAVAAVAWTLSREDSTEAMATPEERSATAHAPASRSHWPVVVAIAISGATALGAEVVWTRLLSLLLGATVYTFSLIVAVFLAGIGLGSAGGAAAARSAASPRAAFGVCQVLLFASIFWASYALAAGLPYWPVAPGLARGPMDEFQLDLARCLWAVLPAACFWGASFPLALASVAAEGRALDRSTGLVYGANTLGGIAGAVVATLVLIPSLGTQASEGVLLAATALAAALLLVPTPSGPSGALEYRWGRVLPGVACLAMLRWATSAVPATPAALVAWGHNTAARHATLGEVVFVGEGMSSSMAVTRTGAVLNYHNAGKIQASSLPADMRLQRMLGHLATLVPDRPRNVLVIGCGAGVTAGAVSVDPAVERETIAEIEPLVPRGVAPKFAAQNDDVVRNPKVHVAIDDARHFVLTTGETFDAVTSDPFDPWVKGAAALYTAEFFDLVKRHLSPGGVVTVFVQLYESSEDSVKSEVATFLEAFPDAMVLGNTINRQGYDVVLVGRLGGGPIDLDAIDARLASPAYARVRGSLHEVGFDSAVQLFGTYASDAAGLAPWLEGAQINRDRNLRLQYLAGFSFERHEEVGIFRHMTEHAAFPEGRFLGAPATLAAMRAAMAAGH